jgi:hypothetical protein
MMAAIMQPYFFPYIGYFQLIARADVFVFYDDVQYMKGGWINRNRIRRDGVASWLTLPVQSGSLSDKISDRSYRDSGDAAKILRQVEEAYRKAPRFGQIFPLIQDIMAFEDANVAAFNINLLTRLASHLNLKTRLIRSSDIPKVESLAGQDRVIDICTRLGATHYVNAIGGRDLYQKAAFASAGLDLSFLQSNAAPLPDGEAAPYLSIIDTLMLSTDTQLQAALANFRLLPAP